MVFSRGYPAELTVWHNHCDEVKELPDGFRATASNETCQIQAMQQKGRRLYGVQFHPELFDDQHPEGRQIVENFLDFNPQRHKATNKWHEFIYALVSLWLENVESM